MANNDTSSRNPATEGRAAALREGIPPGAAGTRGGRAGWRPVAPCACPALAPLAYRGMPNMSVPVMISSRSLALMRAGATLISDGRLCQRVNVACSA